MGQAADRPDLHEDAGRAALAVQLTALAFGIAPEAIAARTRHGAAAALARKVAVYLTHVVFDMPLERVGTAFRRNRSTVSWACRLVEDRRDDPEFDRRLGELEECLRLAPAGGLLAGGAS